MRPQTSEFLTAIRFAKLGWTKSLFRLRRKREQIRAAITFFPEISGHNLQLRLQKLRPDQGDDQGSLRPEDQTGLIHHLYQVHKVLETNWIYFL